MNTDYLVFVSIVIVIYFMYGSIIKYNSLTAFQKGYRFNLILRQLFIITTFIVISFLIDYLAITLFASINNDKFTQDNFILFIFVVLTIFIFIFNHLYNKKLKRKDERIVNLKQETVFTNIKPKERVVKNITNYAHYFNGIEYEKSQKDYTVLNVNIKTTKDDMFKFAKIQNSAIQITPFYANLINYLNLKSKIFQYKKIEQKDINELKKIKELKHLILSKFKIMNQKHYFASISQLFQIVSNSDETEFLSFLNDFPHCKYSSLSLRHAIFYIKYIKEN